MSDKALSQAVVIKVKVMLTVVIKMCKSSFNVRGDWAKRGAVENSP
jgi:hypothetical protein